MRRARHLISEQKNAARKLGFARRKAAHDARGDRATRAADHLLSYVAGLGEGLVISG